MSKWNKFDPADFGSVPQVPCCYVLILDSAWLYIGSTENLRQRIRRHKIRWGYSDRIQTPWGTCLSITGRFRRSTRYADWLMVEARMIKRLRPALNAKGSTRKLSIRKDGRPPTILADDSRPVFARVEHYLSGEGITV